MEEVLSLNDVELFLNGWAQSRMLKSYKVKTLDGAFFVEFDQLVGIRLRKYEAFIYDKMALQKYDFNQMSFGETHFLTLFFESYDFLEYLQSKKYLKVSDEYLMSLNTNDFFKLNLKQNYHTRIVSSLEEASWYNEMRRQNVITKNKLEDGKVKFFYIEIENKLVSFLRLSLIGNSGVIDDVKTLPEFRGKGFAKDLMIASIDFAKHLGISKVLLGSTEDGKKLYEKCAFKYLQVMNIFLRSNDKLT